jgi:hypothetical protein
MPTVKQPLTDDSLRVRQLSHYQFGSVAGEAGMEGIWTLQLVLDEGAWEEVLTVSEDDDGVKGPGPRLRRPATSSPSGTAPSPEWVSTWRS